MLISAKNRKNNVSSPSTIPRPSASSFCPPSRLNLSPLQTRTSAYDPPMPLSASRTSHSAIRRARRAVENMHEYTRQNTKHKPILSPTGAYLKPRGKHHVSLPRGQQRLRIASRHMVCQCPWSPDQHHTRIFLRRTTPFALLW